MRQLIDAGSKIVDSAFQPAGRDSQEVLAQAEQAVFRIAEHGRRGRQDYVALRDAMREAFTVLQARYENQSDVTGRSEEHTSELQSLMRISYAVFCLKKNNTIMK